MDNDKKPELSSPEVAAPRAQPNPAAPPVPVNPWIAYLLDEKASAKKFLKGLKIGPVQVPDQTVRDAFADAVLSEPGRTKRLLTLLRDSAGANDSVRRIAWDLTESVVRRITGYPLPAALETRAYGAAVEAWLDNLPKKPLKSADLQLLFLLLQFGLHRQLLTEDTSFMLIASSVRAVPKRGKRPARSESTVSSPLRVMLATSPVAPVLAALVIHSEAWKAETNAQDQLVQSQQDDIARLTAACEERSELATELRTAIAALEASRAANEAKIAELERQILDLSDGWQHKLDELRGRIRGALSGELTRWVQTALDAARSDPPFTKVIEERLEDTLKLIEREVKWLQPLA